MRHLRTNAMASDKKPAEPTKGTVEYAAGTTWVFDDFSTVDGELVVHSKGAEAGAATSASQHATEDDKMDEFMEDLEGVMDI